MTNVKATRSLSLAACLLVLAACGGGGSSAPSPNQAPQVGAISDVSVDANGQASVSFTVADDRTAAAALTVAAESDNATLLPSDAISVDDGTITRTLTLSPAPDNTGNAVVTVTVSDADGATSSSAFGVTVNALERAAGSFGRELATLEEADDPLLINAVDFVDLGDEEDFSDLLE